MYFHKERLDWNEYFILLFLHFHSLLYRFVPDNIGSAPTVNLLYYLRHLEAMIRAHSAPRYHRDQSQDTPHDSLVLTSHKLNSTRCSGDFPCRPVVQSLPITYYIRRLFYSVLVLLPPTAVIPDMYHTLSFFSSLVQLNDISEIFLPRFPSSSLFF